MIKVEQKNWILKQFSSAQVSVTSPRFSALLHSAAATLTATNPRIICCCCETWMIMNYHIQPGWQSLKAPLCREAAESTQVVTQAQSLLRSPHLPCNLFSRTPPSATLVSSSLSWLQEERSEGRGGARRGHRCLKTTSRDFFFFFYFASASKNTCCTHLSQPGSVGRHLTCHVTPLVWSLAQTLFYWQQCGFSVISWHVLWWAALWMGGSLH